MKKILKKTHLKNMGSIITKWEILIVKMESLKIHLNTNNTNRIFSDKI